MNSGAKWPLLVAKTNWEDHVVNMKINEIIREAAAPPLPPMGGDPNMGMGAGMQPPAQGAAPMGGGMGGDMGAAMPPAEPPPMPDGMDDVDPMDSEHSETASLNVNTILSVLTPIRQNLLYHHSDPQIAIRKVLPALNKANQEGGPITYDTLKQAQSTGKLDGIVEKIVTNSDDGQALIVFKKHESDPPESDAESEGGGGSGGGKSKSSSQSQVSKMAQHARG
jgi:hypothetical protein